MRFLGLAALAVFLASAGAECFGQISEDGEVLGRPRDQVFWFSGNHEDASDPTGCESLRRPPESEFGSGDYSYLCELYRLFNIPLGDDEPESGPILAKALLALPVLTKWNVLDLLMRPSIDIYMTLAKRLALARIRTRSRIRAPAGTIAIDTHVHTCCSPDSLADPSEMLVSAAARGLACVAITDHNTLEGARTAAKVARGLIRKGKLPASFFVIAGEEISSSDGHIIGLFLTSEVEAGGSADWTIRAIHAQGGVAIAAHPLLPHSLNNLANALPFDAVETENAAEKLHYALATDKAREHRARFYAAVTKPRIGASDAHDPQVVAQCYTLARCAATPEAVRAAILSGNVSPASAVSDADETSMVRHGLVRVLALSEGASGLSARLRRITHSEKASFTPLPRPRLTISWEF